MSSQIPLINTPINTHWAPTTTLLETAAMPSNVADHMDDVLDETGSSMMIDSREDNSALFYRDTTVTLLDGTVIVPHIGEQWSSKNHPFWEKEIRALLPRDNFLFLDACNSNSYGDTMLDSRDLPDRYPTYDNVHTKKGKCAIEGSNCFIVNTPKGCRALVGIGGLIATRVALEHQGYYERNRARLEHLAKTMREPSIDDYYRARNIDTLETLQFLHTQLKPLRPYSDSSLKITENHYEKSITNPLTPTEMDTPKAKREAAKIQLAKEEISREYNIPLENIAFVPNFECHLDYTYAVLPDEGVVVLHDDTEVLKMYSADTNFGKNALENIERGSDRLTQIAIRAIQQIGMQPVLVAGCFQRDAEIQFNMMNGLFIKGANETIFFTNDTSEEEDQQGNYEPTDRKLEGNFAQHFLEKMRTVLPERNFRVVYTNTGTGLHMHQAGLHCYTIEKGKPRKTLQSRMVTEIQDVQKTVSQLQQWYTYRYMGRPMSLNYQKTVHALLNSLSNNPIVFIAEDENQQLQGVALTRKRDSSVMLEQVVTAPFNQPYIDPTNRNRMHGVGTFLVQYIATKALRTGLSLHVASPPICDRFLHEKWLCHNTFTEYTNLTRERSHTNDLGRTNYRT